MTAAKPIRIVVIGGGITGLAAAHRAIELGQQSVRSVEVTLIEATNRLGGVIRTERQDGYLIECGPDNFITNKPAGLALVDRLGLTDQLLQTNDAHRRALVVRRGRLHPVPEGFLMMAPTKPWPIVRSPLLSVFGKLRMALEMRVPRTEDNRGDLYDESLESFVRRRLGREAFERIVQPLVAGIYTADPKTLSLRATLPRFLEMERQHGSLIRAMRAQAAASVGKDSGARYSLFVTFVEGMSTLTDALIERIGDERIMQNTRVAGIERTGESWTVQTRCGRSIDADNVVMALPSYTAANLVRSVDDDLADRLDAIEYASSAVVQFGWRRDQIPHPLDGFGFVVPAIENRRILAGSFSSVKYKGRAPRHHVLVRAFLGGATDPQAMDQSDRAMTETARNEFRQLLGVTAPPQFSRVDRWERSMPQYKVGHADRVRGIKAHVSQHPGLHLAGNAYRGVGIPDCISDAERVVGHIFGCHESN